MVFYYVNVYITICEKKILKNEFLYGFLGGCVDFILRDIQNDFDDE